MNTKSPTKGKEFKRKSKGAIARDARRYIQSHSGEVRLVDKKQVK